MRQNCCLSPTPFNIYISDLSSILEWSTAPGVTLEIKPLQYADEPEPAVALLSDLGPDGQL